MTRTYAVGDIHGQLDMLQAAHDLIEQDRVRINDAKAPVVHLGDYTDRGPDSAGVIRYLMTGRAKGLPWRMIKGNHDRMFRLFMEPTQRHDPVLRKDLTWLHERLGGRETLKSYGVPNTDTATEDELHQSFRPYVPHEHLAFLDGLETYYETDELLFVHAGIRPGIALTAQTEEDLIWIRDDFLGDPRDHGKLIVHGHTVVDAPHHAGNHINLDTGAGYFKPLTVAVFEGRTCWTLSPEGRQALLPKP